MLQDVGGGGLMTITWGWLTTIIKLLLLVALISLDYWERRVRLGVLRKHNAMHIFINRGYFLPINRKHQDFTGELAKEFVEKVDPLRRSVHILLFVGLVFTQLF